MSVQEQQFQDNIIYYLLNHYADRVNTRVKLKNIIDLINNELPEDLQIKENIYDILKKLANDSVIEMTKSQISPSTVQRYITVIDNRPTNDITEEVEVFIDKILKK